MDARHRWLDEDDDAETLTRPEEHTPVKIGARRERRQIAFQPRAGNTAFNRGRGKSLEYGYLIDVDYELDFSELVLNFQAVRVIVRGHNLQALLHQIQDHSAALVREEGHDPLQAARTMPARYVVTAMVLEQVQEREDG